MLSAVATKPETATVCADPLYHAISKWEHAQSVLELAKAAELDARADMAALAFPQGAAPAGTAYVPLMNGWRLKGTFGTNITIDRAALPDMLLALAAAGPAGAAAAETVFRYKPELVATVYKNLMPSLASLVDTVLTSKPAMPAFELVAPKAAK